MGLLKTNSEPLPSTTQKCTHDHLEALAERWINDKCSRTDSASMPNYACLDFAIDF